LCLKRERGKREKSVLEVSVDDVMLMEAVDGVENR